MNKAILLGRMVRDAETKASGDKTFTRFSIAVTRKFKNADGKYDADFINCVAFGKTGENIAKFFPKGSQIAISGHIQTGNYKNKDGQTVYTTDVIVDEFDFVGSKKKVAGSDSKTKPVDNDDFMVAPDGIDGELPFK